LTRICLLSLCLFGKSFEGEQLLLLNGFQIKNDICIPRQIDTMLIVSPWKYTGSWPLERKMTFHSLHYKLDSVQREILNCVGNLTNHIVSSANSKKLTCLKQSNPKSFGSISLYIQAMRLTCNYNYRVPIYRFIIELFDKIVWTNTGISILMRMHGLYMDTPITYPLHNLGIVEKDYAPEAEALKSNDIEERQFVPAKVIKGF
jgi:hypothetical protein